MNGHFYTNRNPTDWLRLCMELELSEDFDNIFDDQKDEPELSHPRYIEQFLDEDYDNER